MGVPPGQRAHNSPHVRANRAAIGCQFHIRVEPIDGSWTSTEWRRTMADHFEDVSDTITPPGENRLEAEPRAIRPSSRPLQVEFPATLQQGRESCNTPLTTTAAAPIAGAIVLMVTASTGAITRLSRALQVEKGERLLNSNIKCSLSGAPVLLPSHATSFSCPEADLRQTDIRGGCPPC